MTSTERKGNALNKLSDIFKKNTNNISHSPKTRTHRSASVPKNEEKDHNIKWGKSPQTTTGYATHSKAFIFNDDDDNNKNEYINLSSPASPHSIHSPQKSLHLEQNPLASKEQIKQLANSNTNQSSQQNPLSNVTVIDMENMMKEIDSEKVNINIKSSDDEYSSSFDGMNDNTADEFFPPGYVSPSDKNDKSKRRQSNRKDIWRRMMQSVVDGVGTLMNDDLLTPDDDIKYNNYNDKHYDTVTKNNQLFKYNEYKIERRFTSHEVLNSRYYTKCYKRKNRPRSKSDPSLLPFTKRFHRKLEAQYRPGTMNIFTMKSEKKEKEITYPTRSHQDSIHFRYLFDDSDFEDDSLPDWSDNELDSILRSYDVEVHDTPNTMEEHKTNMNGRKFTDKLSSMNLHKLKDFSQSLPGHIGKGFDKIKSVSDLNINNKVPIKPYGGHVEASESMIMEEFGSDIDHIMSYNVKKKNKLGRDKTRIAVLDIPLQVLRIKDKNGKTHKEHIVSSISDHAIIGSPQTATQIVIKFHDNRDYHLTFESNKQCIQFRNLVEKLRKFNLKMISSRPNTNMTRNKLTMSPGMIVGNADMTRDKRTNSDIGFFDDDDELSMSVSNHPNGGHLQPHDIKKHGARERFDTDMFEDLMDDGNVYTGMATSNVVYRIVKINKWGTKKERTMIVHKADRTVRLFDDKRRCHSEYPLKIMATLDIIDAKNVEVVFVIDQKPTQFVFRSDIDLWDFVEQIRTIAPNEIMVNDRRMGNSKKLTIAANKNGKILKGMVENNIDDEDGVGRIFDEDLDVNPNVLRYSVLRLIRSQAQRHQDITWKQHRRVLYLDLEKRIVRMLTLGMHIKDYKFKDIFLLEKSYINVNQLHMTCKHINKIKEYWYEFVSPQARAEFVGRLLRALPGTKQSQAHSLINNNPLVNHSSESKQEEADYGVNSNNLKPQIDIYADSVQQKDQVSTNPNVVMQRTLSPRGKKKKRRKRLSSEALRGLVSGDDGKVIKSRSVTPQPVQDINVNINGHDNIMSSYGNLDVSALDESEMNGTTSDIDVNMVGLDGDNKNKHGYTEDPLSIIVGSWNVSESEINFANMNMWIPPSKIEPHDIYVIGLQECSPTLRKQWRDGILRHIDSGRNEYGLLNKSWLMGIGIIIIVHRCHMPKISHLEYQTVATGKGNIIGNKGATAISFQFQETSFIFINAHLAARAEKFEKRAKNFNRIIKHLELGRPGLDVLHQFTHTFFIGDLNYRIEKEFYETVEMVKKKQWNELIRTDQLRIFMESNQVFYGFKEGEINFCPTYRWERNKNTISNKREQPPSYCDRILYKSLPQTYDLWQECYLSSHRCFGSDHRPVWSLFKFKPKMPYFTLKSHDINILNKKEKKKKKKSDQYTNISISLVELQASIRVSNSSKKIQIHLEDSIDIILHYNYASKPIRIKGGKFDKTSAVWRWPIETLDSLKIKPFIPDPKFIARTHLFVSFINCSKNNLCIGYSIISLFNAFPKSLIDTNKLIKEYKKIEKQMNLMPSKHNNNNEINSIMDTQSGNKQFNIPILLHGNHCGSLSGFVYADGTIVDKHRKITNLDLLSKYEKQQNNNQNQNNNNQNQKYSLFQRASTRFINHKK